MDKADTKAEETDIELDYRTSLHVASQLFKKHLGLPELQPSVAPSLKEQVCGI